MKGLELSKKYKTLLDKKEIDTPIRLAHFFAQLDHESNLVPNRESLYYTSIENARAIFKTPFKGRTDVFVNSYLKNSVKMANYVYANRMGNGNEASGDGYKNRGGGYMQHTGADEMKILKTRTGIDFVSNPDLLKVEANAMIAAIDFWNRKGLSSFADQDDLDGISDLINIGRLTTSYGDANGFKKRKEKLNYYKIIFGHK
jgi:putative chitinase